MILVDTSAWVELFRGTRSPTHLQLRELLEADEDSVAVTGAVVMEVLAGATGAAQAAELRRGMAGVQLLPLNEPEDFEFAASIYRLVRADGHTVRTQIDCLIAAVAIRSEVPVLTRDADFEAIAAVTPLQLA